MPGHAKRRGKGGGIGAALGGIGQAIGGLDYGKIAEAAVQSVPIVGGVAGSIAGQLGLGADAPQVPDIGGGALVPTAGGMLALHGRHARTPHLAHRHVDAWMVKGSRTLNPLNVKALRRAGRRFEGFSRVVKQAAKHTPGLKWSLGMHSSSHHHRSQGHKRGCRCVACR